MSITREIKKVLKAAGVKNSVSTYHSTITVTVKSEISKEVQEAVKSLATVEAHGSIMDDTRHYTGKSIQFNYQYEPTKSQIEKAAELYNSWSEQTKSDKRVFSYHFSKQLSEVFGPTGRVILNNIYKIY